MLYDYDLVEVGYNFQMSSVIQCKQNQSIEVLWKLIVGYFTLDSWDRKIIISLSISNTICSHK